MSQVLDPPSPSRDHYVNENLIPSTIPEEKACPICMEEWTSDESAIIKTHCGHAFHRECVVAWLGKQEAVSANSCPSCRAICFPKAEAQKETGSILDLSFLYRAMRSEYITKLPAPASAPSVVSDDDMMRLAYAEDGEDAD